MSNEKTVTLSLEDWQNVLAMVEVGVKAVGFAAFVPGGQLMQKMKEQLEAPEPVEDAAE